VNRTLPARSEVDRRFTWDAESVFADEGAWEQAVETIKARLPDLAEFKGHLGDSPDALADWFDANERVHRLMGKVMVYSTMSYSVDTGNQASLARADRARSAAAQLGAATAFALPEMIALGIPKLRGWVSTSPRLAHLGHYFDRIEKLQQHVRSAEVEEVLTQASDPLATALSVHGVLANADLRFSPAVGAGGEAHEVAQSTIGALLTSPDRDLRRTAFENYADAHLAMQHSMAASLAGGIKRDVFYARARGFPSSLAAALEPSHVPPDVYHNVIRTFRENVGTWHRYWRVRRKALGLDVLKPYDTRAPVGESTLNVSYEQAVDWIAEGVKPMGNEYVEVLRRGALQGRWVDVYPNRGKRMGAFSTGVPDTHPLIFMSYNDDIYSMSTLAHELGHAFVLRAQDAAVHLFELRAVPGRSRVEHAPGAGAAAPARHADRPCDPGRGDRRGDVELLSVLLHHAVTCAARAGGARARRARRRDHGRLPERPDGRPDDGGLRA
jgi:oligoendopeptidase F